MPKKKEQITKRQTTQHEDQERGFEVGYDEAVKKLNIDTMSRSQNTHDSVQAVLVQALQNAVETANMISKQAVRHNDIAIDRQWNVDEQGYQVADILNDSKFQDALAVLLANAVANGTKK